MKGKRQMDKNYSNKYFKLETIQEGIYAAIEKKGGGAFANAGIIDLGDQTIVFDTLNTQQAGEALRKVAEEVTGKPVSWVINSHWHGDHIHGNQSFPESKIVSSRKTREKMAEIHPNKMENDKNNSGALHDQIDRLEKELSTSNDPDLATDINFKKEIADSLPTLELVLPRYTFQDEFSIHGTERSVNILTYGGGHTLCDAILYLPEEKIAFLSDLLFVKSHPIFFDETNLEQWAENLKKVDELDMKIVVPGHGPVATKDEFGPIVDYMQDISELAKGDKDIDTIEIPDKYKEWKSGNVFHPNLKVLRKR